MVFQLPVELAFDGGHVDDVFVALRRAQHQGLEAGIDDERRDGIDQLHLQQFHRRHFRHQQPPRISSAQIDLLQILVEPAFGEQMLLAQNILGQQRHLGQFGCPTRCACDGGWVRQTPRSRRALDGMSCSAALSPSIMCV